MAVLRFLDEKVVFCRRDPDLVAVEARPFEEWEAEDFEELPVGEDCGSFDEAKEARRSIEQAGRRKGRGYDLSPEEEQYMWKIVHEQPLQEQSRPCGADVADGTTGGPGPVQFKLDPRFGYPAQRPATCRFGMCRESTPY
jgi:hypothetical protein